MANPFAAKQSGMSSMLESFIPPDVMEAIRVAKEQLPAVIEHVQESIRRIEHKLDTIDVNVQVLLLQIRRLDQNYVPSNDLLPSQFIDHNGDIETVAPETQLKVNGKDNGDGR